MSPGLCVDNDILCGDEQFQEGDIIVREGLRVGRVLSFFFSGRNWDYPTLLAAGECAPPTLWSGGGAHSLAGGVGGVPIPTKGHTLWCFIYVYKYYVVKAMDDDIGQVYCHIKSCNTPSPLFLTPFPFSPLCPFTRPLFPLYPSVSPLSPLPQSLGHKAVSTMYINKPGEMEEWRDFRIDRGEMQLTLIWMCVYMWEDSILTIFHNKKYAK
jgi:hypothetical protein